MKKSKKKKSLVMKEKYNKVWDGKDITRGVKG